MVWCNEINIVIVAISNAHYMKIVGLSYGILVGNTFTDADKRMDGIIIRSDYMIMQPLCLNLIHYASIMHNFLVPIMPKIILAYLMQVYLANITISPSCSN